MKVERMITFVNSSTCPRSVFACFEVAMCVTLPCRVIRRNQNLITEKAKIQILVINAVHKSLLDLLHQYILNFSTSLNKFKTAKFWYVLGNDFGSTIFSQSCVYHNSVKTIYVCVLNFTHGCLRLAFLSGRPLVL